MIKRLCTILLLGWLLVACASGEVVPPATQPVVPGLPVVVKPTGTPSPVPTAAPTQPTSTPIQTLEQVVKDSGAMPGCTAKSLFPTPNPTTEALFPAVSDADWVRGPKTASVTLILYSDFQ